MLPDGTQMRLPSLGYTAWGGRRNEPCEGAMRGRPSVLPRSSTEHPKLGAGGWGAAALGVYPSAGLMSLCHRPRGLGTAHRAWAGGRMVKAGAGVVSRVAGLRPGGGSRRYLWRRPANSRNSSDRARLSPTQTRRPAGETEAQAGGSRPALSTAVWASRAVSWSEGAGSPRESHRAT